MDLVFYLAGDDFLADCEEPLAGRVHPGAPQSTQGPLNPPMGPPSRPTTVDSTWSIAVDLGQGHLAGDDFLAYGEEALAGRVRPWGPQVARLRWT